MTIKPIKQSTFNELVKLSDRKLDSKLDWLNHTSYLEAFEDGGRLYYRAKVTISRNIAEIKEFSTRLNSNGNKVIDIKEDIKEDIKLFDTNYILDTEQILDNRLDFRRGSLRITIEKKSNKDE